MALLKRTDVVIVFEDHGESEDQIENIVDGETRKVAVGRRLHRLACQHDNVDDVADAAECDDRRHEHLEGNRLDEVQQQAVLC